jgi:hypothetical protein
MSCFIAILETLSQRLDNCVSLPNASLKRIKAEIKNLDNEEKFRIERGLSKQTKKTERVKLWK